MPWPVEQKSDFDENDIFDRFRSWRIFETNIVLVVVAI